MNKPIMYSLLFLLMAAGCKNKEGAAEDGVSGSVNYIPASPLYTATYDYSIPPERIDIESAIETSSPLRLSQIASSIEYYAVGDDKYPVTDVVATGDGFIALNQPKLYLYRKGVKRKRVGLKTDYNNWKNKPNAKHLYYDIESTHLYTFLRKITSESVKPISYIGMLPPLDTVLARIYYLYPDSLPAIYYPPQKDEDRIFTFNNKMYAMPFTDGERFYSGVTTYRLNGDTICRFPVGVDKATGTFPDFFPTITWFDYGYLYDNKLTFRLSYCDTIFRLSDEQTIVPAFYLHFGKYRLSLQDIQQEKDRKNTAYINHLKENPKAVFLGIYKEGKSTIQGWITGEDQRDEATVNYQMVYLKTNQKTITLPIDSKGLVNDLDEGLPFWPEGQTDKYLYTIRPAAEMRKEIKWTGSAKQKELKKFMDEVPDDQNVLIVVR